VIRAGGIPRSHVVERHFGNVRLESRRKIGSDGASFQDPLSLEGQLLAIEFEEQRILAHEVFGKYGGGEFIEPFLFDGLEKTGRDFEFLGDLRQLEIATEAFAAEGVADGGHRDDSGSLSQSYYAENLLSGEI